MRFAHNLFRPALCAALMFSTAALAQPTPGAYGPTGFPITPQYAGLVGSYSKALTSGTMAAGLAAASPVYSFRYGGTGNAIIRRVRISATDITTGFAATNATFALYAARAFTASDTGGTAGTLTGNNGKLRTTFPTTAVADIRIASTATLSAGTRTLDTDPLGGVTVGTTTTAGATFLTSGTTVLDPVISGFPLSLNNNEGFVVQATVPATGTWVFTVWVDWDEYSTF